MPIKRIELHTHLEGTIRPELAKEIAKKNHLSLRDSLIDDSGTAYCWHDFLSFLDAYEEESQVIKCPEDYYTITYDYLKYCAKEELIYVEMMYSPEHAERASQIPSIEHVAAIEKAIDDAYERYQITGRIITTAVRHYGVEACEAVARRAHSEPSKYTVGFGLGGDELGFPPAQFKKTYEIAKDAGLGLTAHAGEWVGPEGIIEALDNLQITRLGHGVRAIESDNLVKRLLDENIHLELCPSSNIALGVYPSLDVHPFKRYFDLGVSVSLNSDDPPFFKCTAGGEYELAKEKFGLSENDLLKVSQMAIDASFADDDTKARLKAQLEE